MSTKYPIFDPPMSEDELARVNTLSPEQVQRIDQALLAGACDRWRKVARIVAAVMSELKDRPVGVPDLYYASRISHLVEVGLLEADGDLRGMGISEVRLPQK